MQGQIKNTARLSATVINFSRIFWFVFGHTQRNPRTGFEITPGWLGGIICMEGIEPWSAGRKANTLPTPAPPAEYFMYDITNNH